MYFAQFYANTVSLGTARAAGSPAVYNLISCFHFTEVYVFGRCSRVKVSACIILEICFSGLMASSGKICEIIIAEVERGRGSKVDGNARFI